MILYRLYIVSFVHIALHIIYEITTHCLKILLYFLISIFFLFVITGSKSNIKWIHYAYTYCISKE